jgi:hypothetical protein
MKKKHNFFIEKYLIPVALCLLNICLVHAVYLYASGPAYSATAKLFMTFTLALLAAALILRTRSLLASSILFYLIVVIAACST